MSEQDSPLKGAGSNEMLKKLEDMEQRVQRQLESLKAAKTELDALETVVTDDREAVTVTIAGRGEVRALEISVIGLKIREALGPIVTQTIAQAKEEHMDKLSRLRPSLNGLGR